VSDHPPDVPSFNGFFSFFLPLRVIASHSTPKPTTSSRPSAQDTSEQLPSLLVVTSTPFFPFSPSLTSFDFRTPTINPSRRPTARTYCTTSPGSSLGLQLGPGLRRLAAWLPFFLGPSPQKPSPSRGFQAKPGRDITTRNILDAVISKSVTKP
jgi:hypothetical protein